MKKEPESSPYMGIPSSDFIDILLQGDEQADEAAYYLLHNRVRLQLKRRFEVYHNRLMDDFEDILEDFFLYLREGKDGGNRTPYQSLRRIRKKEVFEAWLTNTFRNYLSVRAESEERLLFSGLDPDDIAGKDGAAFTAGTDYSAGIDRTAGTEYTVGAEHATSIDNATYIGQMTSSDHATSRDRMTSIGHETNIDHETSIGHETSIDHATNIDHATGIGHAVNIGHSASFLHTDCIHHSASPLTDERILSLASHLIAYAHQTFNPHYRFILLRSLLTMLDQRQALPSEEVANALGMSPLSYRVTAHRTKCSLAKLRDRLLRGDHLQLDDSHLQMARHINDDFTHLYPTLLVYYNQTIDSLPCSAAIKQLRQRHYEATGNQLHEPVEPYHANLTVTGFWNKLGRWMPPPSRPSHP